MSDRRRGTAGHVLPSLAVGGGAPRARRRRDVRRVAGSRRGAGSFLRPGTSSTRSRSPASRAGLRLQLLRSLVTAGRAPVACAAILQRRQPDVVLGGGGYVAGPMVLRRVASRSIPAALTEADAHLGLANRLARAVREAGLPRLRHPGPRRLEVPRHRPADARRLTSASSQAEARRRFGHLRRRACAAPSSAALAGARASTSSRSRRTATSGPTVLHVSGERDYESLRGRVHRDDYVLARVDGPSSAPPLAARRHRDLARRRDGAGSSPRRALPRSSFRILTRPATTRRRMRATSSAAAAPSSFRRPSSARSGRGRRAACRTGRGSSRCARRCWSMARPEAAEEIAEELIAAWRCSAVDVSGSSGSAVPGLSAYAFLVTCLGAEVRRLGPRRDAVPQRALEGVERRP